MTKTSKLTKGITEEEFDNGYWYADEIKAFAKEIGIANSNKLRKDELEQLIKHYISTGQVKNADRKNVVKSGTKDLDIGLTISLPIINYTSNKQTKNFIKAEANKLTAELKIKSGVWYRLNRWRDEQVTKDKEITYGDLIRQFIKLNQTDKFEKAKVGRYINFLSDFLKNEPGSTRQQAIDEWKKLKTLKIEKNYSSWKQQRKK
ncbi:MAG: SAP domain-containing protein [Chitinophagaceae bacterium]